MNIRLSQYRRQGIASALIEAAICHAKFHVIQVHLTCVTTNLAAIKFYQKHGFIIYGTEPKALKINDEFFDDHMMVFEFAKE